MSSEHVIIECKVMVATDRAVLIRVVEDGKNRDLWLPRSGLDQGDQVSVGDEEVVVLGWLADREGLE